MVLKAYIQWISTKVGPKNSINSFFWQICGVEKRSERLCCGFEFGWFLHRIRDGVYHYEQED